MYYVILQNNIDINMLLIIFYLYSFFDQIDSCNNIFKMFFKIENKEFCTFIFVLNNLLFLVYIKKILNILLLRSEDFSRTNFRIIYFYE